MTLSKLAKLAHVSVSTASKAFSMSDEVSDETRQYVFEVAKQNGCFKKFFNAKYPKYVISVIIPEIDSEYYHRYVSGIAKELAKLNCEMCLSISNFSAENERELIEYYYKYSSVDGVIVIASKVQENLFNDMPVVCVVPFGVNGLEDKPVIRTESITGCTEALKYLKQKDVTDIGILSEKLTVTKKNKVCSVAEELNIPISEDKIFVSEKRFYEGGYDAMSKMIESGKIPRAIICTYDQIAIGAMKRINEYGLRVPEDVAVMGMDDIRESSYLVPALASISHSFEEISAEAARMVVNMLNGDSDVKSLNYVSKFVLRRSFEID